MACNITIRSNHVILHGEIAVVVLNSWNIDEVLAEKLLCEILRSHSGVDHGHVAEFVHHELRNST